MKTKLVIIIAAIFVAYNLSSQKKPNSSLAILSLKTNLPISTSVEENSSVETQRKCGSPIANPKYDAWLAEHVKKQNQFANQKRVTAVYNIPVIFHIIHTGQAVGTTRNLSLAQINSQITRLNEDFRKTNTDQSTYLTQPSFIAKAADVQINFIAARFSPSGAILAEPGVERLSVSSKTWTSPPHSINYIDATIKPNSVWDASQYYNVWVTQISGTILGYAQFPGDDPSTDGVVVDYRYTGNSAVGGVYNKGRTLTHETGHFLGLYHIWGDDGGSCGGTDQIADTPNQGNSRGACPTVNGAVVTDACSTATPGILYQNYMDYSDDKCMVMFTSGQKVVMQDVMATTRASLNTSTVSNSTTGIIETSSNLEVNLFPNPSSGELNVVIDLLNNEEVSILVTNPLGQVVKEIKQLHSNGGTFKIDLSSNPKGIYFVTVKTKSVSKTKRIILQ